MTAIGAWTFDTTGGKPTWFTEAGAEVVTVKDRGITCTRCDAKPERVTTTLDLIAYLARHEGCRPAWARRT